MSTRKQLVDRIISTLQGPTRDQDERTWTVTPMTDTDLTVRVQEPKLISQGMVEIGSELLWVSRVDNSTGDVTIAPFGRGYQSTTAVEHDANSCVVNSPKVPRSQVTQSIAETIRGVYPDLYVIAQHEFPAVAARTTYELPADVDQVHSVRTETIGPTRRWAILNRWSFDPTADPDRFASGKSIDIYTEPVPGQTVRVTYVKAPSAFTDDVTEFSTATGLNASAEEAIVYGSCFRLVGFQEAPRLQISSIESHLRSQLVPPGSTKDAARHFLQLYQLAIQSERERLLRANPSMSHFRYI